MEKEPKYYLLSTKHTFKDDRFLTFWRSNYAGYTNYQEWAGEYTLEQVAPYFGKPGVFAVEKDAADPLFVDWSVDGKPYRVCFNVPLSRRRLGVKVTMLNKRSLTP